MTDPQGATGRSLPGPMSRRAKLTSLVIIIAITLFLLLVRFWFDPPCPPNQIRQDGICVYVIEQEPRPTAP